MKSNIRVLVVDSETTSNELVKYFSSHEVIDIVACKKDGEEALEFIINNHNKIDVIIMDLLIPKMDGLFLLNELQSRRINKSIIVTTNFRDDLIMDEINNLGVDYYMVKPINYQSLESRIINNKLNNKSDRLHMKEAMVADLLHKLGIPSHIRGYQYIREGVMIVYKYGNNISYITKDVYPEIARKFETTATRVERAIRHAIETSWIRGDVKLMDEIFGNSLNVNRDKPTNAEYLTTLADRLKINQTMIFN